MKTIIKQKETFRRTLRLKNAETGAAPDLSKCTAYAQMRKAPGGDLIATATCSVDTSLGLITALWEAEQTALFPLGECGYDIWLVCGAEQKPIFDERVTVVASYTENMGE